MCYDLRIRIYKHWRGLGWMVLRGISKGLCAVNCRANDLQQKGMQVKNIILIRKENKVLT